VSATTDRSLRELIDLAPDAADRARERFAVRDYHGAVLLLEEAVSGGCGYADAYNLLGLSLALVDRPLDALAAFDRALAQNPRYVEAHLNRGVLLNGLGRTEEGQASFTLAEEFGRPDNTGFPAVVGNRLANAHAALGDEYRSAGAWDEAVAQYRRALDLRPGYGDIRLSLARTLLDAQRYAAAAEELDHMLAARPDLLEGLLLRGLAAYFAGDLGRAGSIWDRAAGLHPADGRVEIYRSMLARRETAVAAGGVSGTGGA
jgi:tetratricopeptide (TPR) repeat protein